jgi:hypothetical protein
MRMTHSIGCLGIVLAALQVQASPQSVRIWRAGAATTEGTVDLRASPEAIYQAATDFAHWGSLFSDVKKVEVRSGSRSDAVVRFTSEALESDITIRFNNRLGRVSFQLVSGPPGAESTGEFLTEPTSDPAITRVRGRLYVDVKGPVGWFVSEKKLSAMREAKLRRDLRDLSRRFH